MRQPAMQQAQQLARRWQCRVYIGLQAKNRGADQYVITDVRQDRSLYEVEPDGRSRWIGSPSAPVLVP